MDPRAASLLARARWSLHPAPFAIVGLAPDAPLGGLDAFASIRDAREVTLYIPETAWDAAAARFAEARVERGWRLLTLEAEVPWDAHGVLAALTGALAAEGIPCAALSSYRTDHLLVPGARVDEALAALRALG